MDTMETVDVSDELRNRSEIGRQLVENEEICAVIEQINIACEQHDAVCARAAKEVARRACHRVIMSARNQGKQRVSTEARIAEAVADPNITPGYFTAVLIQQAEARRAAGATRSRAFLARPYHESGVNRFLFSCADEPESCAQNKGTAWKYSLPE